MGERLWPPGIDPSGAGLRIRIYRGGKTVYQETLPGDPYSKSHIAAAKRRREELNSRKKLGLPLHQGDEGATVQLFAEAAQDYMNMLDAKESSHMVYENMLNTYWMPELGRDIVQEITEKQIKQILAGLKLAGKTKRNILIPLRGTFDVAGVKPNPAAGIKPKLGPKKPKQRYKPAERDKLLSVMQGQAQAYFAMFFGAGMRPCELWALTWDGWDGETWLVDKIVDRSRKVRTGTKTNEYRRVYIPKWVRPYVTNLPTRFHGGFVFVNSIGGHYKSAKVFNLDWQKAHKKAKLPLREPYTCRHTRAAELLSTGIDPARAANQLGHSLEMFLRIYSEFIEEFCGKDNAELEGYKKPRAEEA